MKYEVINDGLSVEPDLYSYSREHWVTHHSFKVELNKDGWMVKAIPYPDWEERMAGAKAFRARFIPS